MQSLVMMDAGFRDGDLASAIEKLRNSSYFRYLKPSSLGLQFVSVMSFVTRSPQRGTWLYLQVLQLKTRFPCIILCCAWPFWSPVFSSKFLFSLCDRESVSLLFINSVFFPYQLNVTTHQAISFMARQNLGSQTIAPSVFAVTVPQSA